MRETSERENLQELGHSDETLRAVGGVCSIFSNIIPVQCYYDVKMLMSGLAQDVRYFLGPS